MLTIHSFILISSFCQLFHSRCLFFSIWFTIYIHLSLLFSINGTCRGSIHTYRPIICFISTCRFSLSQLPHSVYFFLPHFYTVMYPLYFLYFSQLLLCKQKVYSYLNSYTLLFNYTVSLVFTFSVHLFSAFLIKAGTFFLYTLFYFPYCCFFMYLLLRKIFFRITVCSAPSWSFALSFLYS